MYILATANLFTRVHTRVEMPRLLKMNISHMIKPIPSTSLSHGHGQGVAAALRAEPHKFFSFESVVLYISKR